MSSKEKLYNSVFLSPFVYLRPSVNTEAVIVLFLLLLQVAMLFITKSFSSILIIFSSLLASFAAEFLSHEKRYEDKFTVISTIIRALIIGLMIPQEFPPVAVFIIVFFILFVNKHTFGGFANSWINPAAMIVAACWIIGMKFFPEINIPYSALQSKNISLALIQNGSFHLNSVDIAITNFLNKRLFSFFGVSVPDGYFSLLWDTHASIPAFRFNLLTIISSIILLGTDVLNPIISAVFIFTYGILVKFFTPLFYGGMLFQGDLILAFLSSGTLFCTFFVLQWHGTTPFSNTGRWIYGFLAGVLAFFILGIGLSPVGFAFIILIVNIFSLFIQSAENHFLKEYTKNVLLSQAELVKEGNDA